MSVRDAWRGHDPLPDDLDERLEELGRVFEKHDVELGYVFGSAAEGRPGSDVDLAVLSSRSLGRELRRDLVDHLKTDRVHLIELTKSNDFLQREVVTTGKTVFSTDPSTQDCYEASVLSDCEGADQVDNSAALPSDPAKRWVFLRWNTLNRQVEELWPHRTCEAADIAGSADLRWEVERGLLIALTLVVNVLDHLRAIPNANSDDSAEGPRLFSRELCSEFGHLNATRLCLSGDAESLPAAELARRLQHALQWLPVFLRETWLWIEAAEDAGQPDTP